MKVSSDSASPACELAGEIRDRLVARIEVEQHAHVAELERRIDERDALAGLRRGDGEVDRDTVVRPTPPLGLKTATTEAGSSLPFWRAPWSSRSGA